MVILSLIKCLGLGIVCCFYLTFNVSWPKGWKRGVVAYTFICFILNQNGPLGEAKISRIHGMEGQLNLNRQNIHLVEKWLNSFKPLKVLSITLTSNDVYFLMYFKISMVNTSILINNSSQPKICHEVFLFWRCMKMYDLLESSILV